MPKRTDIQSILIIGAGPIVIGQACEFDYSGAQACKALKEEGYRVILVNSNPATIMTDPETADVIYIEPVNWRAVEKIIEKEKPDALLPTMGGQTALNCALDLVREGVLEKHGVELIAASREAIEEPRDVVVRTFVNGKPRQENMIAALVHDIPALIAHITEFMTLEAGDVLVPAIPAERIDVAAGDTVVVEAAGIGRLENTIVSEEAYYAGLEAVAA